MAANNQTVPDSGPVPGASESDVEAEEKEDSSTAESTDERGESLPLDQVFEILKNERRRTVLSYLADHEEPVSLGDLAEFVAANENDTPVAQISSRERKCAYVGLYQCHLPKMDNMDIIEFNQNRGLVETGPNADQLKQYMDWSDSPSRPWPLYYGAIGATGIAALAVATVAGTTGSVALAVCLPFLLGIAAVSVVHHRSDD